MLQHQLQESPAKIGMNSGEDEIRTDHTDVLSNDDTTPSPSLSHNLHSDYTVPTSNLRDVSPPTSLIVESSVVAVPNAAANNDEQRRSIFGSTVQTKYGTLQSPASLSNSSIPLYTTSPNGTTMVPMDNDGPPTTTTTSTSPLVLPSHPHQPTLPLPGDSTPVFSNVHETRHAQSLVLALAFAAVWSPNNMMAPNLTEMADDFHIPQHRDLYLGSYCALAVSVLSLPISAAIGITTDLVDARKWLFVLTVLGGAVSTLATGAAQNFGQLVVCRWVTGGCMAGSVPVAFSFLSDLFDVSERNAASSGLTAMMGLGMILGQVYAGRNEGVEWREPFWRAGWCTVALGLLCGLVVKEPVRGGKERAVQTLIAAGSRYERKLNVAGFVKAMRQNASNRILLYQGFISSLPWGVIFVFLNDFLSQERGFSVPSATFIVAVFGAGCAAGGILGGYWGQVVMGWDRSYLPLFMAVTTVLGVVPFLILLNSTFTNAHGFLGITVAFSGGLIASLPSVNVRPCLINVNLPETRGASLTAANLLINLGRGVGPCCITFIQWIAHGDRRFAFNVTVRVQALLALGCVPPSYPLCLDGCFVAHFRCSTPLAHENPPTRSG